MLDHLWNYKAIYAQYMTASHLNMNKPSDFTNNCH